MTTTMVFIDSKSITGNEFSLNLLVLYITHSLPVLLEESKNLMKKFLYIISLAIFMKVIDKMNYASIIYIVAV